MSERRHRRRLSDWRQPCQPAIRTAGDCQPPGNELLTDDWSSSTRPSLRSSCRKLLHTFFSLSLSRTSSCVQCGAHVHVNKGSSGAFRLQKGQRSAQHSYSDLGFLSTCQQFRAFGELTLSSSRSTLSNQLAGWVSVTMPHC